MTTVAIRDGIMAADSRITSGELIISQSIEKIFTHNGYVLGVAGFYGDALKARKWMLDGMIDECPDIEDGSEAVLLTPEGDVFAFWENQTKILLSNDPFYAFGTGREVAYGALAMGASAVEAVEIAKLYDIYSGGAVLSYRCGLRVEQMSVQTRLID